MTTCKHKSQYQEALQRMKEQGIVPLSAIGYNEAMGDATYSTAERLLWGQEAFNHMTNAMYAQADKIKKLETANADLLVTLEAAKQQNVNNVNELSGSLNKAMDRVNQLIAERDDLLVKVAKLESEKVCHGDQCRLNRIRELEGKVISCRKALEKLACLGNGDKWGNSTGNVIAQDALKSTATDNVKSAGIDLIAQERQRQIEVEGLTAEHDAEHRHGELAIAASCYALPKRHRSLHQNTYKGITRLLPMKWPWDAEWWKPTADDRIRELVKAGALIAAEIDRLQAEVNHE